MLAVAPDQSIEKIEISGGVDMITINLSPNDVSPIKGSPNIGFSEGEAEVKVKFVENKVDEKSVVDDYGLLLTFNVGGSICYLEKAVKNAAPAIERGSTATHAPYALQPGPEGEIWYRVEDDDGFDADSWVHIEWWTNPDGSVTAKTSFREIFVEK